MKNGFYIIDAHCHIYPEKIAQKAVAGTDAFYGTTAAGTGTVSDLVDMGERAGVDRFVVQSVATTPKQVPSINAFIADSVNNNPDKLTGLGTLHPDCDDMQKEVENIVSLGLKGVKLHPDIQRFAVDDEKCMIMYELCEKHKLPVLMHTGDYRYDFSNPDRVANVLKAFPDMLLIGAHLGGWSVWQEASEKLYKFDNLMVDCSSTFGFASPGIAKTAMEKFGYERVMFGTDYPMWSPEKELETFFEMGIPEKHLETVLSGNAKKLWNI